MSLDRKFLEAQMLYEKLIADLEAKLAEKEKETESLKDNWNVLCDYLGDCVIKYDNEDLNGIYAEVLDKVNILKRYDYKRYQDKISFAVEKLVGVQKYISDNAVYVEEESFGREINDYIDNQIKQLKEGK